RRDDLTIGFPVQKSPRGQTDLPLLVTGKCYTPYGCPNPRPGARPPRTPAWSVDESFARLQRAGWNVGDVGTAAGWLVTGSNGETLVEGRGGGQAEAWWRACLAARALGMLAGSRPGVE